MMANKKYVKNLFDELVYLYYLIPNSSEEYALNGYFKNRLINPNSNDRNARESLKEFMRICPPVSKYKNTSIRKNIKELTTKANNQSVEMNVHDIMIMDIMINDFSDQIFQEQVEKEKGLLNKLNPLKRKPRFDINKMEEINDKLQNIYRYRTTLSQYIRL